MSNVLRLAIVDPSDGTRDELKNMLLGIEMVWLEAECARYEFFDDVIGQTTPDIGVVSLDADPEKAIELIESLRESAPECSILAISTAADGDLILQSMRAGTKEFLTRPLDVQDFVRALERIGNEQFGTTGGKSRSCKMVAIAGATGGVGTTSLAVNIGCALARNKENTVALIDLDLSLGDADVNLDTIPDYTLVDVAQNISRLDFTLLKRSLVKHASGLYLLPRPVQLQETSLITPDNLHRVLGLLKATFTHLIIDLSKSYSEVDMVALQAADEVLMVTQLDLPCLRNIVRLLSSFDEIEGMKEKTKIVINRIGLGSAQISLKKAQETISRDIYWQIPNDYRVMVEVRNNGVPLVEQAPRASITQAIVGLADDLDGVTSEEAAETPSGIWRRFLPGSTLVKTE